MSKTHIGTVVLFFAAFGGTIFGVSQTSQTVAQAPIPARILNATKVFVSNAGADSGLFPSPFSGDANRGYNQFYAGLKAQGHYQLVADPADAELVLELHLSAPSGSTRDLSVNKVNGASAPLPMFRLVVYDAKTHFILWSITQSIEIAFIQKTHDRNFDQALADILLGYESLTGNGGRVAQ